MGINASSYTYLYCTKTPRDFLQIKVSSEFENWLFISIQSQWRSKFRFERGKFSCLIGSKVLDITYSATCKLQGGLHITGKLPVKIFFLLKSPIFLMLLILHGNFSIGSRASAWNRRLNIYSPSCNAIRENVQNKKHKRNSCLDIFAVNA